jgi:phage terminase small subunit
MQVLQDHPSHDDASGLPAFRLNSRKRSFVSHSLVCRNAAEAPRRAGYSPRTADRQGHRLLRNVEVSAEIKRREDEANSQLIARFHEVCVVLTRIIRTSVGDVIDGNGNLRVGALSDPAVAQGIRHFHRDPRTGSWRV